MIKKQTLEEIKFQNKKVSKMLKLLLIKISDIMDIQAIKIDNFIQKLDEVDIDFCAKEIKELLE